MRILITGGCGFIGTNLINDLIKNEKVQKIIVIDNLYTGTFLKGIHDHEKVIFYNKDIRDNDLNGDLSLLEIFENEKPDYVFHFAGLVSIYDCHKYPYFAFENNVMGSIKVFETCLKTNVKKVIISETSAMYENSESLPHIENDWNPQTIYATTKATLHLLAESYRKTKGLTYTGLRYFNVYGKLQDWKRTIPPASCGFAIRLLNGKNPIIFGDGNRRRDFIHVDDVNSFHLKCIEDRKTDNEVFNLGTGKSYSLFEMIENIANILNIKDYSINFAPEIAGESFEIFANIDKAKSIGWEPKVSFEQGHKDLILYLKKLHEQDIFPKDFMEDINFNEVKI